MKVYSPKSGLAIHITEHIKLYTDPKDLKFLFGKPKEK